MEECVATSTWLDSRPSKSRWTAALHLSGVIQASVRLHLDLGSYRRLDTRDPAQIATALIGVPALKRGPHLTTALLHVTHALSLPVNMGVQYVSRSQMFFWSCQHSLCGLESAVFLSKWLQTVAETLGKEPLTGVSPCLTV